MLTLIAVLLAVLILLISPVARAVVVVGVAIAVWLALLAGAWIVLVWSSRAL